MGERIAVKTGSLFERTTSQKRQLALQTEKSTVDVNVFQSLDSADSTKFAERVSDGDASEEELSSFQHLAPGLAAQVADAQSSATPSSPAQTSATQSSDPHHPTAQGSMPPGLISQGSEQLSKAQPPCAAAGVGSQAGVVALMPAMLYSIKQVISIRTVAHAVKIVFTFP